MAQFLNETSSNILWKKP